MDITGLFTGLIRPRGQSGFRVFGMRPEGRPKSRACKAALPCVLQPLTSEIRSVVSSPFVSQSLLSAFDFQPPFFAYFAYFAVPDAPFSISAFPCKFQLFRF